MRICKQLVHSEDLTLQRTIERCWVAEKVLREPGLSLFWNMYEVVMTQSGGGCCRRGMPAWASPTSGNWCGSSLCDVSDDEVALPVGGAASGQHASVCDPRAVRQDVANLYNNSWLNERWGRVTCPRGSGPTAMTEVFPSGAAVTSQRVESIIIVDDSLLLQTLNGQQLRLQGSSSSSSTSSRFSPSADAR